MNPVVRKFVRAALGSSAAGTSDPDLLKRFVDAADQDAFAELVRRHGPMVLDVCRCVLGNHADAEDAFQATFLALAQRAGSIHKAGSLAAWLHGVAYRIARKLRTQTARRREHEARVPAREPAAPDDLSWAEVRLAVHEALAALGERYRAPLILCYLGGMTQDRAAEALGLSRSAVKKRLERGRDQLRERLARKGLGPTALLAALASPAIVCAVPPALAESVVTLAALVAAGNLPAGAVSPAVLALTPPEVSPMALSPLKVLMYALPVLVAGIVLTSAPVRQETRAQDPVVPAPPWGDGKQETPADRDAQWLAGEWKVAFIEARGRAAFPDEDLTDARIIFKDGKAEVKDLKAMFVRNFAFKIDPTASPKAIDVTFLEGEQKGVTFEGAYVTLQNEVRMCLRLEHTKLGRPKGFATVSGAGLYTFFLRPVKEKGPPPKLVVNPPKADAPVLPTDHLSARIAVGEPKGDAGILALAVEVENTSKNESQVVYDPTKLKVELTDAAGKPVAESQVKAREWLSVRGIIPPGGYVGFRGFQSGGDRPKDGVLLTSGTQHWVLKPGKYTAKGTVTLGLRAGLDVFDERFPAGGEQREVGVRLFAPAHPFKVELKPITFEVPAK